MAVWTTIPDSDIDPDSPFTTGLATAYRENVIAAFEGASGAPQLHPSSALSDTITTEGSQSIGATARWVTPQGVYNMCGDSNIDANGSAASLYVSTGWRENTTSNVSGLIICDGTNMGIYNFTSISYIVYWQRFNG